MSSLSLVDSPSVPAFKCPACGGSLIQKSQARLLTVGLLLILSPILAWLFPLLWAPAIILALTGLYLLAWATIGQGRWCRSCKMFRSGS